MQLIAEIAKCFALLSFAPQKVICLDIHWMQYCSRQTEHQSEEDYYQNLDQYVPLVMGFESEVGFQKATLSSKIASSNL
ncbi:MAG: hypothetical protein KVP17_003844 [Porospora cf. gigantea B]|uniref:uncharacterized protein n=1 Tax=Porospora cf. gigantea B TaxID=2853592 RepID=UPI003571833B|nr:MAG: hypothetical protein KVP17_003844 [Porospora cf. gigantea B]